MSLLDVYVIFAYYDSAVNNPRKMGKITSQKLNNHYVVEKIKEISNYHSSSLHWNLREIRETLPVVVDKVISSYNNISKKLGIEFHSDIGIEKFKQKVTKSAISFMNTSRVKAIQAQFREYKTIQPKEVLTSLTKAKINIENYLGGIYYLTVDEVETNDNVLNLIEAKHTEKTKLPSISDIKDGLLKMILYTNLKTAKVDRKEYMVKPVLKLTSALLKGTFTSIMSNEMIEDFFCNNAFNSRQKVLLEKLIRECRENQILLRIERGKI